ncbi:hypothetical protein, partial [Vreelandella olivaria]|uniref:hypothetical protein n=1 Tax=Vreelandella olivaria TaxID=390919 RepID=UPI00201F15A6
DHHHGVLIVVISLEARHADHSSSVFSILPKLSRQRGFSTGSTPRSAANMERSGKFVRQQRLVISSLDLHVLNYLSYKMVQ